MKKLYKLIFIVFILIPMQISFNNFGQSILHNEIDDTTISHETDELNTNKLLENTKHLIESILILEKDSERINEQTLGETVNPQTDGSLETNKDPIQPEEIVELVKLSKDSESAVVEELKAQESEMQEDLSNAEAATTESPEHVTVNQIQKKTKPDIESFEEWKDIKLKEKAKIKAEIFNAKIEKKTVTALNPSEKNESPSDTNIPVGSYKDDNDHEDDSHTIVQHRKNYASPDCGAKLVGNNPEANHASHILLESKDDYMLNSCSNKIWFSIELCEAIKITSFELANLELFSNVPRLFRVYASERFIQSSSTKDWPSKYLIGTFEAKNIRSIQAFSLSDDIIKHANDSENSTSNLETFPSPVVVNYAKYVRFEMLSHYGNQHYCPLSLVRIYGSSMSDDQEEVHDDDEIAIPLNKDQEKQPVENLVVDAETDSLELTQTASILSEISTLFYNNLVSVLTEKIQMNVDSLLTRFNDFQKSKTESSTAADTDEADLNLKNQIVPVDLYNIMCTCNSFVENQFIDCCRCLETFEQASKRFQNNDTFNWLNNKCGYFFLMSTTTNELLGRYTNNMKFSLSGTEGLMENVQDDQSYFKLTMNKINYYIENTWLKGHIKTIHSNYTSSQNVNNKNNNINLLNLTNETIIDDDLKAHHTTNINKDLNANKQDNSDLVVNLKLEQASEKSQNLDANTNRILINNDESSQKITGPNEQILMDEQFIMDETQKAESTTLAPLTDVRPETTTNLPDEASPDSFHAVEETSDSPTTTQTSTSTTTTTTVASTTTKPLTAPKESVVVYGKEAVLMRLNNRIKILELNMSLSSQYLEKLSRHYRIQMEEMETTFNFTTNALKEATRVSDERDQKQQMRIIELEKRLELLHQTIDSLVVYVEKITFQTNILSLAVVVLISLTVVVEVTKKLFSSKSNKPRQQHKRDSQAVQLTQSQIELIIERHFNSLMKAKRKSFSESISSSNQLDEVETLGLRKVQII